MRVEQPHRVNHVKYGSSKVFRTQFWLLEMTWHAEEHLAEANEVDITGVLCFTPLRPVSARVWLGIFLEFVWQQ